ncbi:uncharacterized protein LODBEIA_P23260 [Lodderomyces beijingensis]|uniref:VPS37 C-terminal domain-containing protein n=1 Tax=Lodderomyces beijingensis TaxID=1775926 RepID=A0ABP0ZPK2_9ASCO
MSTPTPPQAYQIPQLIPPLTLETLAPFPLPPKLNSLPSTQFTQFTTNPELISSYIHTLQAYRRQISTLTSSLSTLTHVLQSEVRDSLILKYEQLISKIQDQLGQLQQLFQEFVNLETIQYQLLSANFNSDLLKLKYRKMVERLNDVSIEIASGATRGGAGGGDDEVGRMLERFRDSRKVYHLQREKLNRWEEERVSGFI